MDSKIQWRETGEIRKFLTFVIRQIASKIFGKNNTEALVISRRLLYPYDGRTDTDFIEYISRHLKVLWIAEKVKRKPSLRAPDASSSFRSPVHGTPYPGSLQAGTQTR